MARLFAAVWPSPAVVEQLRSLERQVGPGLRWSTEDQWHVTLRFFGEADPGEAAAALSGMRCARAVARMGPVGRQLGRGAFVFPVEGLDPLAEAVAVATRDIGLPPSERPFTGHLTLARVKEHARPVLPMVSMVSMVAEWTVDEVTLVRSELHPDGARYTVIHRVQLTGSVGEPLRPAGAP